MVAASRMLGDQTTRLIKSRVAQGIHGDSYSTRPAVYSFLKPPGREEAIRNYLRSKGRKATGNRALFQQGYAEWKAAFKGYGGLRRSVNLNLTGEFIGSFRYRGYVRGERQATATVQFDRQKRSYGRLTNGQLFRILNRRGTLPGGPLAPTQAERTRVFDNVVRFLLAD